MMDRSTTTMSYQAWRRDLEVATSWLSHYYIAIFSCVYMIGMFCEEICDEFFCILF